MCVCGGYIPGPLGRTGRLVRTVDRNENKVHGTKSSANITSEQKSNTIKAQTRMRKNASDTDFASKLQFIYNNTGCCK